MTFFYKSILKLRKITPSELSELASISSKKIDGVITYDGCPKNCDHHSRMYDLNCYLNAKNI